MTEKEKQDIKDLFEAMGKTDAKFCIGQVVGSQTNNFYNGNGNGNDTPLATIRPSAYDDDDDNVDDDGDGDRVELELCHFIHPEKTDDKERLQIDREMRNLVTNNSVQSICSYLNEMAAERKVLLPPNPQSAMAELQRLGMPCEDKEGFSYKNFCKYYLK